MLPRLLTRLFLPLYEKWSVPCEAHGRREYQDLSPLAARTAGCPATEEGRQAAADEVASPVDPLFH